MELDLFKKFLQKYLKDKGFEKIKSKYYLKDEKFLCMIHYYKSYYGSTYYFDYYFFLGEFEKPYIINQDNAQTYTPCVGRRFYFTEKDKYSCDYLDYTEEQLKCLLDSNFKERIMPPFIEGKQYLLKNFGTLYTTFLPQEKILPLLKD